MHVLPVGVWLWSHRDSHTHKPRLTHEPTQNQMQTDRQTLTDTHNKELISEAAHTHTHTEVCVTKERYTTHRNTNTCTKPNGNRALWCLSFYAQDTTVLSRRNHMPEDEHKRAAERERHTHTQHTHTHTQTDRHTEFGLESQHVQCVAVCSSG